MVFERSHAYGIIPPKGQEEAEHDDQGPDSRKRQEKGIDAKSAFWTLVMVL